MKRLAAEIKPDTPAIRQASSTGMIPVRISLADDTFVTVAIQPSYKVSRVVELVAKKCDLRYHDTYALYAIPPPRAYATDGVLVRQPEHLIDDDTFIAAFADVDRLYAEESDKPPGSQTAVCAHDIQQWCLIQVA